MALRSEVQKTDNSKLGRAVLSNRAGQSKKPPVVDATKATATKKKTSKKTSKK